VHIDALEGYRLGPQQRRLWQLQDGRSPFRAVAAVEMCGDIEDIALRKAFEEVISRNDILRTSFHRRAGMRIPIQVVNRGSRLHWKETDLRGMTVPDREARLRVIRTAWAASDENPGSVYGVDVDLIRLDGRHRVLLAAVASLCADSWAVASLTRQICETASGVERAARDSEDEFQYFQYAQWQNELLESDEDEEKLARDYWARQTPHNFTVALPQEQRTQGAAGFDPATVEFELSGDNIAAAESVAAQFNLTLEEVWATCWALLIRRLSGKQDVVIWQTMDGRPHAELHGAIGLYAKSIPIQVRIDCTSTFAASLLEWSSLAREAYSLQDYYDPANSPELEPAGYPIGFEYLNAWAQVQGETGYRLVALDSYIDCFKLKLSCLESGGVAGARIHYDPRVYDRTTVELIAGWFTSLAHQALRDAQTPIDRFELPGDIEKHRSAIELNDTGAQDVPAEYIHRIFEDRTELVPDAVAAVFEDQFLTNRELNRRANWLARRLRSMNVGPDRLVGLLIGRSLEFLIGILGVLKAGGAYVPLDPAYPRKRLTAILDSMVAGIVVTSTERIPPDVEFAGVTININEGFDESKEELDSNQALRLTPQNLAYVIFTSGSTGVPKGVAVDHGCLLNYVRGIAERLALPAQARFATVSTFAADLGNTMIYPSLIGGGCLYIVPVERATDPAQLREYFLRHNIDCLKIVPSHLSALLASGNFPLPSQRLVIGGEALRAGLIDELFRLDPHCAIFNHYGPTETTVGVFTHPVSIPGISGAAPIGRPIPAVTGYVLDEYMQPAPLGAPGELFIGGGTVARGYLNRPELTAAKFVPDLFTARHGARLYRTGDRARNLPDGCVEFLGRVDDQVKFHGHRIEMNEIRTALNRHPLVKDSVVRVARDEKDNEVLIAYYVARQEIAVAELRNCLRDSLLEEIIPNFFVHLQRLPLTTNGKVDHAALPGVEEAKKLVGRNSALPGTLVEELTAGIWAEVLGLERVGVDDNFFNLGGHSLLATQVISRVREVLNTEVSLRTLFESPTVAAFSEAVERERRGGKPADVAPIRAVSRNAEIPLAFAQQRLWFIHQLDPSSAAYNIPRAMRLRGALVVSALQQSLTALVARHEVLRTRFQALGGRPFQVIDDAAEVEMPILNATTLSEAQRRERTDEIVGLEALRPFSLERGPLLRVALVRLSADEHVLLLTLHHIVSDGWSTGVLVQELTTLYEGYSAGQPVRLAELPVQYADFAVWQREQIQGDVLEEQLSYWRQELAGLPHLEFPDGRSHLALSTTRSATVPFGVSRESTAALKGLSRREGVTLFMTILAAFQTIVARCAQQEDVAVGISVAGRNRRETEGLIGFFVNQLVLRADLSGNPTFRQVMEQARQKTLAAYARQDVPFEKLVEEIAPERSMSRNPLFQVKLVFQNAPERRARLAALKVEPFEEVTSEAKFDLLFIVGEERGRLVGAFYSGAHVFPRGYVELLNAEMQELLRLVGRGADLPLSSLRAELDQFSKQYRESRKVALTNAFEKSLSRQRQTRAAARLAPIGEPGERAV
jgi:amino acid adenylation domain-containing protein